MDRQQESFQHGVVTQRIHMMLHHFSKSHSCACAADIASRVKYGQQTFLRFPENLLNSRARYAKAFQVSFSTSGVCLCSGYQLVCLSVCLSICLFVYLSVHPSVCLCICLSVCLSVCLCAGLPNCLSVCLLHVRQPKWYHDRLCHSASQHECMRLA